jgi:hypothetical protein
MWEQSASGRVSHQFEPVILIATLAMIPVRPTFVARVLASL